MLQAVGTRDPFQRTVNVDVLTFLNIMAAIRYNIRAVCLHHVRCLKLTDSYPRGRRYDRHTRWCAVPLREHPHPAVRREVRHFVVPNT